MNFYKEKKIPCEKGRENCVFLEIKVCKKCTLRLSHYKKSV